MELENLLKEINYTEEDVKKVTEAIATLKKAYNDIANKNLGFHGFSVYPELTSNGAVVSVRPTPTTFYSHKEMIEQHQHHGMTFNHFLHEAIDKLNTPQHAEVFVSYKEGEEIKQRQIERLLSIEENNEKKLELRCYGEKEI